MGAASTSPERNLLFGLLALQNGLIDQDQLVAAFRVWTRDKSRQIADYLVDRGDLDADQRDAVEVMVVSPREETRRQTPRRAWPPFPPADPPARASPQLGDSEIEATLARVGCGPALEPVRWRRRPHRHLLRRLGHFRRPALPYPAASRERRPGSRVRRPRRRIEPRGRRQADPRLPRRRPRQPRPLRARGRDHRRAGAPRHRAGLRPGHLRRRPALLRHAVHPR